MHYDSGRIDRDAPLASGKEGVIFCMGICLGDSRLSKSDFGFLGVYTPVSDIPREHAGRGA